MCYPLRGSRGSRAEPETEPETEPAQPAPCQRTSLMEQLLRCHCHRKVTPAAATPGVRARARACECRVCTGGSHIARRPVCMALVCASCRHCIWVSRQTCCTNVCVHFSACMRTCVCTYLCVCCICLYNVA